MADTGIDNKGAGQGNGYTSGELQYLLQAYQEQYSVLTRELKDASDSVMGISSAIETLDGNDRVIGRESLVPVGSGLYVYANVTEKSTVISIGGGLLMETDAASAKDMLNKRFEAERNNMNRISRQMKQVEDTIYEISYKIGELEAD